MDKDLEEIKNQIAIKKYELAAAEENETMQLLKDKKQEILKSTAAEEISSKIAVEDVKSDFSKRAQEIRARNVKTAEQEYENETAELRLKHLKAELQLQHKYDMEALDKDAKHRQMLDKRKKLVSKYGYLYDQSESNLTNAIDSNGNSYKVPKDFSYSETVNKFRQFGRNLSKLDKPLLQTIKWGLIIGGIVLGVFILKWTGIIK